MKVEPEAFDLGALLSELLTTGPSVTASHLDVVDRDIVVDGTKTKIHCYSLPLDGNSRVRWKPLVEFLRRRIVDYAIPRKRIEAAKKEMESTGSTAAIVELNAEAARLFTTLKKTGEGGELLLFAMVEAIFGFPQILCKMSLKTSTAVHYHGSDGIYAEAAKDGGLNLYWGESKFYEDAKAAISACLESLAPYLRDEEGDDATRKQDLFLINEHADFSRPESLDAIRAFFRPDDPQSKKVRHCGVALVGFDCAAYPPGTQECVLEEVSSALRELLPKWKEHVGARLSHEKLEQFDIHLLCVPLQSVSEFRAHFLKLMGGGT